MTSGSHAGSARTDTRCSAAPLPCVNQTERCVALKLNECAAHGVAAVASPNSIPANLITFTQTCLPDAL
ncbi:hypothetical protein SKAU_G00368000 [Synaphobranchus kaupii]|uniref:Uncharacterized protein n=1 Tax=Synaphobranchus kaupii TaxID=118154 RepID=A0A9Q1EFE9_SYNKA|nr:hypothetical protein SKAU_G00368000 [Synaphobranchus kaupii]